MDKSVDNGESESSVAFPIVITIILVVFICLLFVLYYQTKKENEAFEERFKDYFGMQYPGVNAKIGKVGKEDAWIIAEKRVALGLSLAEKDFCISLRYYNKFANPEKFLLVRDTARYFRFKVPPLPNIGPDGQCVTMP